jgi:hypothetical protein
MGKSLDMHNVDGKPYVDILRSPGFYMNRKSFFTGFNVNKKSDLKIDFCKSAKLLGLYYLNDDKVDHSGYYEFQYLETGVNIQHTIKEITPVSIYVSGGVNWNIPSDYFKREQRKLITQGGNQTISQYKIDRKQIPGINAGIGIKKKQINNNTIGLELIYHYQIGTIIGSKIDYLENNIVVNQYEVKSSGSYIALSAFYSFPFVQTHQNEDLKEEGKELNSKGKVSTYAAYMEFGGPAVYLSINIEKNLSIGKHARLGGRLGFGSNFFFGSLDVNDVDAEGIGMIGGMNVQIGGGGVFFDVGTNSYTCIDPKGRFSSISAFSFGVRFQGTVDSPFVRLAGLMLLEDDRRKDFNSLWPGLAFGMSF